MGKARTRYTSNSSAVFDKCKFHSNAACISLTGRADSGSYRGLTSAPQTSQGYRSWMRRRDYQYPFRVRKTPLMPLPTCSICGCSYSTTPMTPRRPTRYFQKYVMRQSKIMSLHLSAFVLVKYSLHLLVLALLPSTSARLFMQSRVVGCSRPCTFSDICARKACTLCSSSHHLVDPIL